MISIVVAGPPSDRRIAGLLSRALAPYGPVLRVGHRGLSLPATPPQFLVWDTKHPGQLEGGPILLILKESVQELTGFIPPPCQAVAVGSDNAAALDYLAGYELQAITCGLSSKDTLTLTSISDTSAVVALQRSLVSWDGSVVEPAELPVRLSCPADSHSLLCCAAALAYAGLLGRQDELFF